MSYPVDVPAPPAIAGDIVPTAIVVPAARPSAADLTIADVLAQTPTAVPENITPTIPDATVGSTPLPPTAAPIAPDLGMTTAIPLGRAAARPDLDLAPSPIAPSSIVPSSIKPPPAALQAEGIIELLADQQTFDRDRGVFTAEGNVSMRFRNSLVVADRLQVNLLNRFAVAEGKVTLKRGEQVLQGDRFEYNFVQGEGQIRGARGEILIPKLNDESPGALPTDLSAGRNIARPIGDQIYANQPPQQVTPGSGGVNINLGSQSNTSGQASATGTVGGQINRLRFEAETADFTPEGLVAANVRITNDPFSPPELELRSRKVRIKRLSPLRDELTAENPQLVLDQRLKLPLLRNRLVIDRRKRPPGLFQIGFDSDERGGLFFSRSFDVVNTANWRFSLTPQFLVQRAFTDGFGPKAFGLKADLEGRLGPRTTIRGLGRLSGLNFGGSEDLFRGSLRAQQLVGTHTLSLEASYRDRLFNNSLGFQDVRSSIGLLFYSPVIPIGKTGINASYQLGYQNITANTDRLNLLDVVRPNDRITLSRFQGSLALSRGFNLWQGKPLPATATQGLRYTPTPLVPYVNLTLGTTAIASLYSNGDTQNTLGGSIQLAGQFGHSSKDFLDYTAFNITYSNSARSGLSPFLFDRAADTQVLFAGITQQVYGPWRIGFQTAWNLNTQREISTDYIVEYSRRTHRILFRYNPVQQLGSINFQISDFNWTGGSEAFGGSGVTPITNGVRGANE
jgi:Protein of unknown function (DUF3769)